jgi:mRNA interferase MazF
MSTVICPITTNVLINHELLRVLIPKGQLDLDSDILVDQIRTIENKKLIKKISRLNYEQIKKIKKGLMIVLDL